MNIGFDLDGTLDHTELRDLCNALYDAGHTIHIITAGASDRYGSYEDAMEKKLMKLRLLDVRYTHLHLVYNAAGYTEAGQEKAALVNYHNIIMMFDDSSTFVKEMVRGTTAVILHVKRHGGEE